MAVKVLMGASGRLVKKVKKVALVPEVCRGRKVQQAQQAHEACRAKKVSSQCTFKQMTPVQLAQEQFGFVPAQRPKRCLWQWNLMYVPAFV